MELSSKKSLKQTAILLGALAYTGLGFLPVIGPLLVGFLVGYLRRGGPKDGFTHGIIASVIGSVIMLILLFTVILPIQQGYTLPVLLASWILILWMFSGIIFAGLGGGLSAILWNAQDFIDNRFNFTETKNSRTRGGVSYTICPECGSQIRNEEECTTCSKKT